MQRHRDLAGSPVRSASEVWTTLSQLVLDTLGRSPHIAESEISIALAAAAPAGIMLVATGHLQANSIVLIAGDLQLFISTVSGDQAFSVEENLNPVPGAADARDWTLHLPTPEPVGASIRSLVSGVAHVSTEPPSTVDSKSSSVSSAEVASSPLNLRALATRRANR